MFNGTLWKGIGVVVAAFLLILFLDWIINPKGDWGPIFIVVPVMAGGLYWLIRAVDKKKQP